MKDHISLNDMLKNAEKKVSRTEEEIKFNYPGIITCLDTKVLIQIVKEYGIITEQKMLFKEHESKNILDINYPYFENMGKKGESKEKNTFFYYTKNPNVITLKEYLGDNFKIKLDRKEKKEFLKKISQLHSKNTLDEVLQRIDTIHYVKENEFIKYYLKIYKEGRDYTMIIDDTDPYLENASYKDSLECKNVRTKLEEVLVFYLNKDEDIKNKPLPLYYRENQKAKLKGSLNSLFHLDELKNHINLMIDRIKKSDLRNYTSTYKPNIFDREVIFKVYRGDEPHNLLQNEFSTIDFFSKNISSYTKFCLPPTIYCYGRLGDFYVLIMEKICGITLDKFFKELEQDKQKSIIDILLEDIIKIGVEGRVNNLPTLYGELTEQKLHEWLKKGIIEKLKTEKTANLMQKIKDNYNIISGLLLNSPFFYNKDSPTGNWLVNDTYIGIIDFENTHFGPLQMDLITLFEGKNNIELEKDELIQVLKDIPEKVNKYVTENKKEFPILNENDFIKTYFAASIHRNLSMAGTSKERNDLNQMIIHLERAKYSAEKLKSLIEDKNESSSP